MTVELFSSECSQRYIFTAETFEQTYWRCSKCELKSNSFKRARENYSTLESGKRELKSNFSIIHFVFGE